MEQRRRPQQPEYYTVMVPKQYTDSDRDLDRQKKLLELGDPNFFGGGSYSNSSCRVASTPIKVKSAAVQIPNSNSNSSTTNIQRQMELLQLGDVNLFGIGGSPMAETLAARQRSNR
jgi:hypothetical protein